jgi:predicted flap endonuclease-1-like 5' DNA nuclease
MDQFMQDPVFYWLVWGIFTVAGIIIGWSLRAAIPERAVRNALERIEQEKNTLARLYTHLKHQHDLREADFKRVSLELGTMRQQVQQFENDQARRLAQDQSFAGRAERAEANAAQYAQKVAALDLLNQNLRARNAELTTQLNRLQEELDAWQVIYADFQRIQQKMAALEQSATSLEAERSQLLRELEAARIEIENLQLEQIQQKTQQPKRQTTAQADRKGGRAAPEHTDDLKIINGISPFAEQQLYALGIYTFDQISNWDDTAIVAFAKALGISPGKIYQEDWVGQARHLVAGNQ